MNPPTYQPPANFVRIATSHPLETAAWRMPNGARHVELCDETEATWQRYCADLAERSRRNLAAAWKKRHEESRAAFARRVKP